jgi:hypothetical protein
MSVPDCVDRSIVIVISAVELTEECSIRLKYRDISLRYESEFTRAVYHDLGRVWLMAV